MTSEEIRVFCESVYTQTYRKFLVEVDADKKSKRTSTEEIEREAQKEAIKETAIKGLTSFPDVDVSALWRVIYETHVNHKSGIDDFTTIHNVISADQSWRKSSGHAFESIIKTLGSKALAGDNIEIILQKELSALIKLEELANEPRDISWLKEQIKGSIFDLYAVVLSRGKKYCFGCIQSKTSIRDRVTRDREPSLKAMDSYFWSVSVVLDGDFLKNRKFVAMTNGGTNEFTRNGWHGMYVLSLKQAEDRIYPTDLNFTNFREHAVEAANMWLTQRQWLQNDWRASSKESERDKR